MSLLEVKNLSLKYSPNTPFEKLAVDDISFSVNKGDFLGIIGHTGSGKSSLVQMLNGLIKPTNGEVLFNDDNIWKEPSKIRNVRFNIGLVFQYPEYQLFEETVYKDIAFGPKNMGLSPDEIDRRVKSACKFVSIDESLLNESPFDLSGGEKRRCAIAGVIAMEPQLLILDEPTAGLDPIGRELILSQLAQLHREKNNTVIIVSHSMEDIARLCDKVMVLNKGRLVMFDETSKVFSSEEELRKYSLRVPDITKITEGLRKSGFDIPKGILTVDDAVFNITEMLKREGRL